MTHNVLLRRGRVIDPASGMDSVADVRVVDGVIAAVGTLDPESPERVIDIDGLILAPGLIDVHVHLREPGQEWKETIGTGTAAAAAGGFTTVFCMPNTDPSLDSVVALEELKRRTHRDALVVVHPIATISEGRRGTRVTDYQALAIVGAVGFSDDGDTTQDSGIMRAALEASSQLKLPIMVHCEDATLTGGVMHEGDASEKMGVRGLPPAAEEIVIRRDLALTEVTGGWLHVCHVSTATGAELIATAKQQGVHVTAEVMPHHLTMTDDWVGGYRRLENAIEPEGLGTPGEAESKVNPPLRTGADTRCLLNALKQGDVDLLATDHAPHARTEKQGKSLQKAAFGLTGSELALPTMLALVRAGNLTLSDMVKYFSAIPARLWGLPAGTLRPGTPADIVVFDPEETWRVGPDTLVSRGANTPLAGMTLRGRVKLTLVGGDERYRDW